MKSTKVLTINPIPSGVNQKLVPAKKYNELWDDVARIEKKVFESDYGFPKALSFSVLNGLAVSSGGVGEEVYVSAKNFINGVHYSGKEDLYYAIKLNPDVPLPTDWDTDPSKVFVSATTGDGAVVTDIYIRAGVDGTPQKASTYFLA